jgi:hypothetical protein
MLSTAFSNSGEGCSDTLANPVSVSIVSVFDSDFEIGSR